MPLPYSIFFKIKGSSFTYRNYFNIYYTYSHSIFPRLCGLFWEPGVYQIYLNLGLYLYYRLGKNDKIQFSVFLINIIFVQSTTGYMLAAIIIAAIVINQKKLNVFSKYLIKIIIGMLAITIVLIIFVQKMNATNVAGDSYFDRISQAKTGIELFLHRPVFGTGFYNTSLYAILDKTKSGNSNGLITWLYTTGVVGMAVALFPFIYNVFKTKGKNRIGRYLWVIFVLIVNMSEPVYSLSMMVFILAHEYYVVFSTSNNVGYPNM